MTKESAMKKLPIGIQTFREIIEKDYAYVDKTGIAVRLINHYKYVFLSRPRRFGKSLFVDTLRQLFAGRKELFAGLAAETKHDWRVNYPVIPISFGGGNFRSKERLHNNLAMILEENAKRLSIQCKAASPDTFFAELICKSKEKYGQSAVILIDEYDKPILDNIDQPEMAAYAREELKALYSVIKNSDANIRFAFLTGVSKFSKVSIFSGINNIVDISLNEKYSSICGYTKEDLHNVFAEYLQNADMEKVKMWYDGYSFAGEHLYNPFDILLFLDNDLKFQNYWFETGTPAFLVKLLKEKRFFLPQLNNFKAGEELLSSFDIDNISPVPLLFQTGYLTIKDTLQVGVMTQYRLGFPNLEVSSAFNNSLLDIFMSTEKKFSLQTDGYLALYNNNMEQFRDAVFALFASISYHNYTNEEIAKYEGFYASIIYTWLASSRLLLYVEKSTNKGRIDMVIEMENTIYIIEFKVDISGESAIKQIKERGYAEQYQTRKKKIVLIGIIFSSKEKNVTEFLCEEV